MLSGVKLKKNERHLQTQKHSSLMFWLFYEHFINNYLLTQFFIFQTVWCVRVKRFYTNAYLFSFFCVCFFSLLQTPFSSKTFYASLNSTQKFKENINYLLLFKLVEWNNRHPVILGCSITFEAYAKIVREKTTKYALKAAKVPLDTDGRMHTYVWYLTKYSSQQTLDVLTSFKKCFV